MNKSSVAGLEPEIKSGQGFQHLRSSKKDGTAGTMSQEKEKSCLFPIVPKSPPNGRLCPHNNIRTGAGKKPLEESHHCKDCGKFLEYSPIERFKRSKPGLEPLSAILARIEFGGEG